MHVLGESCLNVTFAAAKTVLDVDALFLGSCCQRIYRIVVIDLEELSVVELLIVFRRMKVWLFSFEKIGLVVEVVEVYLFVIHRASII